MIERRREIINVHKNWKINRSSKGDSAVVEQEKNKNTLG